MKLRTVMAAVLLATICTFVESASYSDEDATAFDDYSENYMDNILDVAEKRHGHFVYRRGCVRRGGNCDHRPADCCVNSSCRCNLWGANCRCQRRGIFQKWGK